MTVETPDVLAAKEAFIEAKVREYYSRKRANEAADISQAAEVHYAWAVRQLEKAESKYLAVSKKTWWKI